MIEEGSAAQKVGCKDCKPASAFITPPELKHKYLSGAMFIVLVIITGGLFFGLRHDPAFVSLNSRAAVVSISLITLGGWITLITLYWRQYIKGAWCTVGTDGMTNINHVHDRNITNFHLSDGRSGIMPVHSTIRCSGWFSRGVGHYVVLEHHGDSLFQIRVDGEGPWAISLAVPYYGKDRYYPNDFLAIGQGAFGTDAALLGLLTNGASLNQHLKALLEYGEVTRELRITSLQVAVLGEHLTAVLMRIQNFRPTMRKSQQEKVLRTLAEEGLAAVSVGEEILEAWRTAAAQTFGERIIPPTPQDDTAPPPDVTSPVLHAALGPASDPM